MLVLFIIPGELSSFMKQEQTEEVIFTENVSYGNITSANMHRDREMDAAQVEDDYEQI